MAEVKLSCPTLLAVTAVAALAQMVAWPAAAAAAPGLVSGNDAQGNASVVAGSSEGELDAPDEPLAGRDMLTLPASGSRPPPPSEFLVENRGFLRLVYHPSAFEAARRITVHADAARASLATALGQSVLEEVEVRIARTTDELTMLAPREAPPEKNATAVVYPSLSLVLLSIRTPEGAPSALDELFAHELAHVALFDAAAGRPLPRWLHEGFAAHAAGEAKLTRAQILWTAHVRRSLRSFAELESFPDDARAAKIAWAQSADFVRFIAHDRDGTRFAATIARARSGDSLDRALTDAYGTDLRGLEQAWREDLAFRSVTLPLSVGAAAGWAAAAAAWLVRRRRRRGDTFARPVEAQLTPPEAELAPSEPQLLVCDRGLGHVAYIVAQKAVPKVEHAGKRHTLH